MRSSSGRLRHGNVVDAVVVDAVVTVAAAQLFAPSDERREGRVMFTSRQCNPVSFGGGSPGLAGGRAAECRRW
jgi:hypothetical protein